MPMFKIALVAGSVAAALAAGPAFSQERATAHGDRDIMFYQGNGTVKMMRTDTSGHNEIMKHARALAEGAAVYRSGNKFYLVENKKMENGKMLFDQMGSWNLTDRQGQGAQ